MTKPNNCPNEGACTQFADTLGRLDTISHGAFPNPVAVAAALAGALRVDRELTRLAQSVPSDENICGEPCPRWSFIVKK